jgi:tRNA 2-selenouridine synthase
MSILIDVDDLFRLDRLPVVDVRSSGEFRQGHIPGAINVALLDDSERAQVGTTYKRQGPPLAIAEAESFVVAKMDRLIDSVAASVVGRDCILHCWRGGMRSEGFARLIQRHDFKPRLLQGGYKAFRQAAHRCFAETRRVIILDGHSGAGKTRLLTALRAAGEQVIDLEMLAEHRGSVFGGIGRLPQPTVEQFENQLFLQWRVLDPDKPVWIEGESQAIGRVFSPTPLWDQMSAAPAIRVEVERKQRVEHLVEEYGELPVDDLAGAIQRIEKRLGSARLKEALGALDRRDMHRFAELALEYYDKAYAKSAQTLPRDRVTTVPLASPGQSDCVQLLSRLGEELTSSFNGKP